MATYSSAQEYVCNRPHENRTYVVTGAAGGIGESVCIILAKEGANLALWDMSEEALKATQADVEKTGVECSIHVVNVAEMESVNSAMARVMEIHGKLDGILNGAGILSRNPRPVGNLDIGDFNRVLNVNLFGTVNCMRAAIPHLSSGASIVNIASTAGLIAQPAGTAYTASKHAVIGVSKTAARDYGKQNIRVNAIAPGVIATVMMDQIKELNDMSPDDIAANTCLGRLGDPSEVGHLAAFLLSTRASYLTGSTYNVDGGMLA